MDRYRQIDEAKKTEQINIIQTVRQTETARKRKKERESQSKRQTYRQRRDKEAKYITG